MEQTWVNTKLKIVAIIPARGGSKGIPRKNIQVLAGKPLIVYTIDSALKSKHVNKVYVSTEDDEIKNISKKYGSEVIDRPENLAMDSTPSIDVILHSLEYLEGMGIKVDVVLLLQPTSPLRNEVDIDQAIESFIKNECEALVSVCKAEHSPYLSLNIEEGYLTPIFNKMYLKTRRQDLPLAYIPNGAIYISKPEYLCKYQTVYCPKSIPFIMSAEKSIDIDNEVDLSLAELLIKKEEIK